MPLGEEVCPHTAGRGRGGVRDGGKSNVRGRSPSPPCTAGRPLPH